MINFTFDGTAFSTVAGQNGFVLNRVGFLAPERDVTVVEVPGRHSTLTVDNKRWNDTTGYYQCFIQSGYQDKINDLIDWLSKVGHKRLEDTLDSTVYRMAKFVGITEKKVKDNDIARFDVEFSFAPQRWLKSGETATTLTTAGTITNPTRHESNPSIVIHGSGNGTLTINGKNVVIEGIENGMVLDSDIHRAYLGTDGLDGHITGEYPVLVSGGNIVSFSGGITSVEITPRWWTL